MSSESLEERVALIERDSRDHAKSISALTLEVGALKDWREMVNLTAAREDERDKSLYRRLDEIERSVEEVRAEAQAGLKEIKGAASRVQWIVISAVIMGFIAFIFKGGLVL